MGGSFSSVDRCYMGFAGHPPTADKGRDALVRHLDAVQGSRIRVRRPQFGARRRGGAVPA